MKQTMKRYLMAAAVLLPLLFSCKERAGDAEGEAARAIPVAEKNWVDTMTLRCVPFSREIVSNGTLEGERRAELAFPSVGTVSKVYVHNGSRVKAGSAIAALDTEALELSLENARQGLERARFDYLDRLVSYGYGNDTTQVPLELREAARARSGYAAAELAVRTAELSLRGAVLRAPFSGVVANLAVKPWEQASGVVCLVIDDTTLDVRFTLLESELPGLFVGQTVAVAPFIVPDARYEGRIREINPFVDARGQVSIVASLRGARGLVEGMNVKLYIRSEGTPQLVVPKNAVVMRDGYDVIFTLDTVQMKAQWLYVDIAGSNTTDHAITGCARKRTEVREGAVVITSGNLNLADGSAVEIRKQP
ncbi:MAG: efflux RND transporter periplasmic adaptor subunit [Bacteroidales bacterium]|nr:efflux RND transporter periplasmic adaptor subunit [Bacteroidales bacterium]